MSTVAPGEHLIAFRDGSYKTVASVSWKQSQWIHMTKACGSVVRINPFNVNYIEQGPPPTLGPGALVKAAPGQGSIAMEAAGAATGRRDQQI